jgi:hypothetical protein
MKEPKEIVDILERGIELPSGTDERFAGYGVMGVPFTSGHILALRRFPITSIGYGYTSLWHRNPLGHWTFIQDVPPQNGCSRYFGSAVDRILERKIDINWKNPNEFSVEIEGDYPVQWDVSLKLDTMARMMNTAAGLIPDRWWRKRALLSIVGKTGSILLGGGRFNLTGNVPNGQQFLSNPKTVWMVDSSRAVICNRNLGPVGPLPEQVRLEDIWLPQSGRFFIGNVYLESFDPARHIAVTSRSSATVFDGFCSV